jgi:lactoylglutathione lyase
MHPAGPSIPMDGLLTHSLVFSDQDRSRPYYQSVFDGTVVWEREPVIFQVSNSLAILNVSGCPKPTVTLTTPIDLDRASAFMSVRVADTHEVYTDRSAEGATFLTEPKDHGLEVPHISETRTVIFDRSWPVDRPFADMTSLTRIISALVYLSDSGAAAFEADSS